MPVHSLSKTLFHVIAIFCLLMTAALWFASVGEFTALNELVHKLSALHFAGYGLEIVDPQKRRVAVALLGSCVGIYLSVSFFTIGWMNGSLKALKAFSSLTGSLLGLIFCGLWIKFLGDDHIVASSEKMELLGMSISLVFGAIFLCWVGFRKSIVRRSTGDAATPSAVVPAKSDDKSNLPSVEALLDDEGAPVAEGDEGVPAAEGDEGEDGVEAPILDSVADELNQESVEDDQMKEEATPDALFEDDEEIPPPVEDVTEETALPPEESDVSDEFEIPALSPIEPLSPNPVPQESTVKDDPELIAEAVPPLPPEEVQDAEDTDAMSALEGDIPDQVEEAELREPPPSDSLDPEEPPPLPDEGIKGSQEAA